MRFFKNWRWQTAQCPEGTKENSPRFQPWDKIGKRPSPEGAAEIGKMFSAVPSGLGFLSFIFPPLKRRAIFGRHFVTFAPPICSIFKS
jgi:hypothetical protein